MTWHEVESTTVTLANVTSGSDFTSSPTVKGADERVELPVDYRASLAYRPGLWSAAADIGRGFGGTSFHGGIERRLGRLEVRGGGRYTVQKWNPAVGAGIDLSPRVSIDVAIFGTTANIERRRDTAIALSMRINHMK